MGAAAGTRTVHSRLVRTTPVLLYNSYYAWTLIGVTNMKTLLAVEKSTE